MAALVVGLLVGQAISKSAAAAAIAIPLGVAAAGWLAWRSSRRLTDELRLLGEYVRDGRGPVDRPSPALEQADEVRELRDEVDRTLRHWRQADESWRAQVANLNRDAALLRSILGTMVEGVIVLDGHTRFLYVNPAARAMLDLRKRESSGRLLHELTRSSALLEFVESIRQLGAGRATEIELSRESRTLAISGSPLPSDQGTGVVLVLHDVTELRRLERLRRDFVSNVSHELKTPLTSIQAYADTLLEGGLDDPGINRSFVERIMEQAERLRDLIFDIISLAQIESQQESTARERCVLREVIEESLRTHGGPAEARQLTLSAEIPTEPIEVRSDPEALRTILDNLVGNAIRYTPAGGRVVLRLRSTAEVAILEVEDTGIGIPAEYRERVFERFFRVDKARSREVGGTGLGLAIVKHLIGVLGGRIELESELGRGSLFRVQLPLESADQTSTGSEPSDVFIKSSQSTDSILTIHP